MHWCRTGDLWRAVADSPEFPNIAELVFATTYITPQVLASWGRDEGLWIVRIWWGAAPRLLCAGSRKRRQRQRGWAAVPHLERGGASVCLSFSVSILRASCRGRPKPGFRPAAAVLSSTDAAGLISDPLPQAGLASSSGILQPSGI